MDGRRDLASSPVDWVRRHPLLVFFVLAFVFAWAIMVPLTLSSWGLFAFPASPPLLIFMGYGPTWAALVVAGALGGRAAIRALLRRLLVWRVGWPWYLAAILLNGGIIVAALGLYALVGGVVPAWPAFNPALLVNVILTFVVVMLINGEEIGWRGFALPRLEARWGVPVAIALLGTLEALFHLPIFFSQGSSEAGGQNGTPFLAFWVSSVAAVLLLTWVYNNTRGSLLLAYLFHGSMNTWSNVLPFPATSGAFFWCLAGVQCAVCAVVVAAFGPARLSRKPASEMPFAAEPVPVLDPAGVAPLAPVPLPAR
jgi:membrane protease YdiL (CAAX protease family)